MDKSIRKTIEVLKDLIKINQDRMEAYHQAAVKFIMNEAELKLIFLKMIDEGKKLTAELTTELIAHGQEPGGDLQRMGMLYKEWMDINLIFHGSNRVDILDFCEYIEDAIVMVYDSALQQDDITETAFTLLTKQKQELWFAYLEIKQLRAKELSYY